MISLQNQYGEKVKKLYKCILTKKDKLWNTDVIFRFTSLVGERRNNGEKCGISIHAPLQGATLLVDVLYIENHISIHAPLWGATTSVVQPSPK